ncbi:hypothetical protein ABEB36_011819 [Hypothenemus hampei]|uniref:Gamma-aminobutyric acid type B receptor subunit 2 n=1 Tax=Hypothenemus hampei TaxID=57062 RepID=A0ABD1E9C7_HYPHA
MAGFRIELCVLILLISFTSYSFAWTEIDKCLTDLPEVNPRQYFYFNGTSMDIIIETSERVTHQLSTWVFYYFIKEVVGYSKLKVVTGRDDFIIEDVIQRLTDRLLPVANSTINLEVWIPPDYDTYITEFVKECGSVSPSGRFGWFIPLNLTEPIRSYYNPNGDPDIKSIHWRYFRDRQFVKFFDIDEKILINMSHNYPNILKQNGYISPEGWPNLYVPKQCQNGDSCAVLLTSEYSAMKFVIQHIEENNLYVKVLFLGKYLEKIVEELTKTINNMGLTKSLVILSWTPSDVILYESNFVTVSFENCERLNFTQSDQVHYKYEMHRLVKVAWSKIESAARPLYDALRSFKFEVMEYRHLLDLYERLHRTKSMAEIACRWMRENRDTWYHWKKSLQNDIYIGGIFPMTGSSYAGNAIARGSKLAINAINGNRTILGNYKLNLLLTDGQCRADNVMKKFIDFIVDQNYYRNLVGVLGPACSDTVEPLAGVSKHYRIMVISYSAEGSSFSNRDKYPYFFRTIGENKHYKHVYEQLFKRMNWKRVAALTEDGQKYTEYISLMQDDLEQNNIVFIANKKFPRERETEPMTRYLKDLKSKRARIIIADVVDEIARQVMCEAYKLGMTSTQGYVWFLPMWLNRTWYNTNYFNQYRNESVNCTTNDMIKAITGYFSMTHAYFAPGDQVMQENKTVAEWRKEYESGGQASDYAGFAYDAVWVYALALDKLSKNDSEALADMHSANTTDKLVSLIAQTDFYGVSGRIKFRGGPSRFSIINILQWYDNDTHTIGEFLPNLTDDKPEILGGQLKIDQTQIRWFTADGNVPGDGTLPPPVCPIDSFARAFNVECQTAVIILNVIVAVMLGVTVMGVCLYLKFKYDKRVKMQKALMHELGLRYEQKFTDDFNKLEVAREQVEITRRLGEGAFGTVYGGEAHINSYGWCPVAVKTLKRGSSAEDRIDFLAEADNMKRFDHRNIVKLMGVITKSVPLATLMEYCLYGDLKNFLLARRHLVMKNVKGSEDVSPKRLTAMALDIARGLSYLASMRYVHRDLACRNCLVNAQRVVKIGDFGMSRPMNDYQYTLTRKGMLPVRWMAPESLNSGVFTTASDVWSYGVVLYEICTFGCYPWFGKQNTEVVELVKAGACLDVPKGAKPQLEGLMKSCWARDPTNRPPASSIVEYIANMPKLLHPCMDLPLPSITLDEDSVIGPNEAVEFRRGQTSNQIGGRNLWLEDLKDQEATTDDEENNEEEEDSSVVSIPLENYCPKAPLLGSTPKTGIGNSLINFTKFNMQSGTSGMGGGWNNHNEDGNTAATNGYINSSNL